jgi:pyruvate dehydrogenase E1 component
MEGMFRQIGIWNQVGQNYVPQDADQLMFYKDPRPARSCRKASTRPAPWPTGSPPAPATATHGVQMIPFYIFYSMFGLQRVGDLVWAAGDQRARGFLLGGTAGRTTLNGEGLQHEDGHSQPDPRRHPQLRQLRPDLRLRGRGDRAGRPAPHGRRAGGRVLLPHGDERELRASGDAGRRRAEDILKGMYLFRKGAASNGPRVQLMGSGTIFREVIAAAELLKKDWGVERRPLVLPQLQRAGARRPGRRALEPAASDGKPAHLARRACLADTRGPVIAATDYMRAFAEQIRSLVPRRYTVLGTDGFGRSDTREAAAPLLRGRSHWVTLAALKALADDGQMKKEKVAEAIRKYGLDPNKPNPVKV